MIKNLKEGKEYFFIDPYVDEIRKGVLKKIENNIGFMNFDSGTQGVFLENIFKTEDEAFKEREKQHQKKIKEFKKEIEKDESLIKMIHETVKIRLQDKNQPYLIAIFKERMAEFISDRKNLETTLKEMHFQDGMMNLSLGGEAPKLFMKLLVDFFEANGGENFLNITFESEGKKYNINIENCNGTTSLPEKTEKIVKVLAKMYFAYLNKDEFCPHGFEEEAEKLAKPIIEEYGGLEKLLKENN